MSARNVAGAKTVCDVTWRKRCLDSKMVVDQSSKRLLMFFSRIVYRFYKSLLVMYVVGLKIKDSAKRKCKTHSFHHFLLQCKNWENFLYKRFLNNYVSLPFFLGGCLKVNPEHRLTISAILERLAAIAETNNYNLKSPIEIARKTTDISSESPHMNSNHIPSNRPPPPRPSQPSPVHQPAPPPRQNQPHRPAPPPQRPVMPPPLQQQRVNESKQASYGLLSSIKGGAGSFLKNLKDTSSKVMQTMQQYVILFCVERDFSVILIEDQWVGRI